MLSVASVLFVTPAFSCIAMIDKLTQPLPLDSTASYTLYE